MFAARDWSLEARGNGFLPDTNVSVIHVWDDLDLEEPFDLGFDPGL